MAKYFIGSKNCRRKALSFVASGTLGSHAVHVVQYSHDALDYIVDSRGTHVVRTLNCVQAIPSLRPINCQINTV